MDYMFLFLIFFNLIGSIYLLFNFKKNTLIKYEGIIKMDEDLYIKIDKELFDVIKKNVEENILSDVLYNFKKNNNYYRYPNDVILNSIIVYELNNFLKKNIKN